MPKSNVIISVHIGQAGCNFGAACWELSCLEHDVDLNGNCSENATVEHSVFMEVGSKKVVPRAVFVDMEPSAVDSIRTGNLRQLFRPNNLLNGKDDAANCFGRGFLTLGKEMLEPVKERIRSTAEECDSMQCFAIYRAAGGGTGSGFTACLSEELSQDYPKLNLFDFCITLSSGISGPVEPYNTAFTLHNSLEYFNLAFLFDNNSCYNIYDRFLDVCDVKLMNINQLLARVNSSISAQFRQDSNAIPVHLVPFPRLQFPVVGCAPLLPRLQPLRENITESSIIKSCYENSNQLVKCDMKSGTYMACVLLLSGSINQACVNAALETLKKKKSIRFVEWSPVRLKVFIISKPAKILPQGDLAQVPRSCVMLSNGSHIKDILSKINKKFDVLYSKRAFVHWYISEGMEEADFQDTRLDLECLMADYFKIESEV